MELSLEHVVAKFLWYFPQIYLDENTNFERVIFLPETKNRRIHKITSSQRSKNPAIHENWPPKKSNDSTEHGALSKKPCLSGTVLDNFEVDQTYFHENLVYYQEYEATTPGIR